ncbi:hypothetical protein FRB99_004870 [Tulasnella sp. 403]|nr:hypothetical protein FRB99_004870 [Tulasnella sp. 403]
MHARSVVTLLLAFLFGSLFQHAQARPTNAALEPRASSPPCTPTYTCPPGPPATPINDFSLQQGPILYCEYESPDGFNVIGCNYDSSNGGVWVGGFNSCPTAATLVHGCTRKRTLIQTNRVQRKSYDPSKWRDKAIFRAVKGGPQ